MRDRGEREGGRRGTGDIEKRGARGGEREERYKEPPTIKQKEPMMNKTPTQYQINLG